MLRSSAWAKEPRERPHWGAEDAANASGKTSWQRKTAEGTRPERDSDRFGGIGGILYTQPTALLIASYTNNPGWRESGAGKKRHGKPFEVFLNRELRTHLRNLSS